MQTSKTAAKRRKSQAPKSQAPTQARLTAEVEALQERLTQIEHSRENALYRVPQSLAELGPRRLPPPGQTAMQAIRGKLETDEALEELLAQLKALD